MEKCPAGPAKIRLQAQRAMALSGALRKTLPRNAAKPAA
jgi:hypothetical protein